jgi:hypothetical protein
MTRQENRPEQTRALLNAQFDQYLEAVEADQQDPGGNALETLSDRLRVQTSQATGIPLKDLKLAEGEAVQTVKEELGIADRKAN